MSALRLARAFAVGVIVPDLNNPIYHELVRGIDETAEELGYHVLLSRTEHMEPGADFLRRLYTSVWRAYGAPEEQAEVFARCTLEGDLLGRVNQGVAIAEIVHLGVVIGERQGLHPCASAGEQSLAD